MHTSLAEAAHVATPAPRIAEAPAPSRPSHALGLGLTAACAIHCLAMPLIALLPVGSFFGSHAAEWLLPAAAVVLGLGVIGADYRKIHRQLVPAAVLGLAAVLLTAGHALHGVIPGSQAIAVAGSACLALALLLNLRIRRHYCACPAHAGRAAPRSS